MNERIKVYLKNINDMLYSDPEFIKLNKSSLNLFFCIKSPMFIMLGLKNIML